jgi:hypothetical protein
MISDVELDVYAHQAKSIFAAIMFSSRAFFLSADVGSVLSLPPDTTLTTIEKDFFKQRDSQTQSPGWELARQKRTAAIKQLQQKGIIQIDTDDVGNQFLKLPWIPDRRLPYKSLTVSQRLTNEVCAGAFGEFSKDVLLHAVDTKKTRKQVAKKKLLANLAISDLNTAATSSNSSSSTIAITASQPTSQQLLAVSSSFTASKATASFTPTGAIQLTDNSATSSSSSSSLALPSTSASQLSVVKALSDLKELYAGFPVVLATSIPQGGAFFFVKKGVFAESRFCHRPYWTGGDGVLGVSHPCRGDQNTGANRTQPECQRSLRRGQIQE